MKKKICFIATVEIAVKFFLLDYIRELSARYDVVIVTNTNNPNFLKNMGLKASVINIPIKRKISPVMDIAALYSLYKLFKYESFDVIHSIMPKSGLLGMTAAFLAKKPIRIHTFTGQVWATRRGLIRYVVKMADKAIALCATHILVDSHSQRDFLIREKIISPLSSTVIGNGSICGVDLKRFSSDPVIRKKIRQNLEIDDSDIIFLFLGRLTREKGLVDLARGFNEVCRAYDNVHLLIVGPDEEGIKNTISSVCRVVGQKLHFIDYTDNPEQYMAAADIFCLPSYREGFGLVIIEAAGSGVPSIATNIYGITDAVDADVTGFLYEPGNIKELISKMIFLVENPGVRKEMGIKARERAIKYYSKEKVISGFLSYYESLPGLQKMPQVRL